ncbi:hypothetical protein BDV95DRAFT_609281 [Massariosphaeria phaeospora]|uniref:Uncharacterized protein n=1 Tax=Massariosphaeria phaeospora TaxID=100035 RepID=A0A7C8I2C7_9PLEO|nr:hypothetical protein BDV95DRAFT_609281 [Massariosphaeria phaeospora]
MADPLTAIGLAGNIVQFVAFCGTLLSKTQELYKSADGALVEYLELEAITTHLDRLTVGMMRAGPQARSEPERQLEDLCRQCRTTAQELLQAVNKLKVDGKSKKWKSFRQALNTIWSSDRIHSISSRLDALRGQIDTTLIVLLRDQNAREHRENALQVEKLSTSISKLGVSTKQWQKDLLETMKHQNWQPQISSDISAFSTQLSSAAETDRKQRATSNIMHLLNFYERADRYERIKEAHAKTFNWLYRGQSTTGTTSERIYRHSFSDWLEKERSIYWVTGKPGSGKSTLMKFMDNDPRTVRHLQRWTNGTELIRAGWFFWNSGTAMQMSRNGLMQALLYQCLEQHSELLPQVFPRRWKNHELFGTDLHPLTWPELTDAFKKLIEYDNSKYRFFIIIDGLDEFDGDIAELIHWIKQTAACPNVKICVASRPWLAFEEAFDNQPNLKLEYLTLGDIELYASENLMENAMFATWHQGNPDDAFQIIQTITEKASGVFLWVYLVVSSLLVGLRDGDRPAELQKRVDQLPSELDLLFKKILDKLEPQHFEQASQLIQIIDAAHEPLSLLELYFAEEGFNVALTVHQQPLTTDEILAKVEIMRRRLLSRCKGLLEPRSIQLQLRIQAQQLEHNKEGGEVSYLHRTVKDFLHSQDIWDYVCSGTDDSFDPNRSLCGLYVLRLKTIPQGDDTIRRLWRLMPPCMKYVKALEQSSGETPLLVIEELDRIGSWITNGPQEIILPSLATSATSNSTPEKHWTQFEPVTVGDAVIRKYCQSIFDYALTCKLYLYVDWSLSRETPITYDLGGRSLLISAIDGKDLDLLRVLLEHGADPNRPELFKPSRTPWSCLLMRPEWDRLWNSEVWLQIAKTSPVRGRDASKYSDLLDKVAQIVTLLLSYGADPWIEIPARFRDCDHCRQSTSRARAYTADDLVRQIFSEWSTERTNQIIGLLEEKRAGSAGALLSNMPKEFLCPECQLRMDSAVRLQPPTLQVPVSKDAGSGWRSSPSPSPTRSAKSASSKRHRLSRSVKDFFSSSNS